MTNDLFDISQDDSRLTLKRRCGPALEGVLALSACGFMFGLMTWRLGEGSPTTNHAAEVMFLRGAAFLVTLLAVAMVLLEIKAFWQVMRGDYWTFDLQELRLEHNGEVVLKLDDISSIQIVEDDDGMCNELRIGTKHGTPVVLQNNSRQMETLEATAREIGDFTGLPIVRERKRS